MRLMVFSLLKNAGPAVGGGRVDADLCGHYNGGGVDREPRRLSDAGAIRRNRSKFELTGEGRDAAAALGEGLDERTAAILRNAGRFCNGMTDDEALAYVRAACPCAAGGQAAHEGTKRRQCKP